MNKSDPTKITRDLHVIFSSQDAHTAAHMHPTVLTAPVPSTTLGHCRPAVADLLSSCLFKPASMSSAAKKHVYMVLVVNVAIITSVLGTARPAGASCSNINHNEAIRHSLGGQWNLLTNGNLEMQAEKALNTASSGQALSWYPHVVNDIGAVYRSSAVCLTSFPLLGFKLKIQGKEMQAQSSRTSIQEPLLSLSPSPYPSPFQSLLFSFFPLLSFPIPFFLVPPYQICPSRYLQGPS